MTEKVELKIQELKRIQSEEYYKKKDADLYAWGLTEKDPSGKEVPVAVTDEEYEALIVASNGVNTLGSRNTVAKALNVVAVCTIVVSFIIGFALMTFAESMKFAYLSIAMLIGILIAVMFWGIAEAIKLLQQIIDSRPGERPEIKVQTPAQPQTQPVAQPAVQMVMQQPQAARPQFVGYTQVQPQPAQPQAQYQVTYTTATPPYVQVNPQQLQGFQQVQPVHYQQIPGQPQMPR